MVRKFQNQRMITEGAFGKKKIPKRFRTMPWKREIKKNILQDKI